MRAAITAVVLLVTASAGQYIERTIWLPDSLLGAQTPKALALDPGRNLIYVGGRYDNRLVVLDGATFQKLSVVELYGTENVNDLHYNSVRDRLYCLNGSQMKVVDGASRTLVKTVDLPSEPDSFVVNPSHNKLYLFDASVAGITVFDCGRDKVAAVIPEYKVQSACWSQAYDKMYFATGGMDKVVVVDPVTDVVLREITGVDYPCAVASVRGGAAIYCANRNDDEVAVIDCAADTVAARMPGGSNPRMLCYSPVVNKVYCGDYGGNDVRIYDAVSNMYLGLVSVSSDPKVMLAHPVSGDVYVAWSRSLAAISGTGDSARVTVSTGSSTVNATWNATATGLLLAAPSYNGVGVFNTQAQMVRRVEMGSNPCEVVVNDATGQCVFATDYRDSIFVVDRPEAEPRPLCYAGADPWPLAFSSSGHRLYWTSNDYYGLLNFLDASAETLVTSFVMAEEGTGFQSSAVTRRTWHWMGGGYRLALIDEERDGLPVLLSMANDITALGLSPRDGTAYLACTAPPVFVLDGRSGLLADSILGVPSHVVAVLCDSAPEMVFFLDRDSGLYIFDPAADTVWRVTYSEGGYAAAAIDLARHRVWAQDSFAMVVYDIVADSIIAVVPLSGKAELIVSDAEAGYVYAVVSDTLLVFDATSCLLSGAVVLRRGPHTLAIDRVFNKLYVSCYDGPCIHVVTRPGRAVFAGPRTGPRVCPPVVGHVLPVSSDHKLLLVDAAGRRVRELLPGSNELGRVAAGVYFALDPKSGAAHKVLVAR